jgi:hypothetical protein
MAFILISRLVCAVADLPAQELLLRGIRCNALGA